VVVEEAVFSHPFDGARWGLGRGSVGELIVILRAVHGSHIDHAVGAFWDSATRSKQVKFEYRGKQRSERLHVVGYAGHNRLMDGLTLPRRKPSARGAGSAFVLACYSENYFGKALEQAGVQSLVTTRALMAPEGYVLAAILRGLADNRTTTEVREHAVAAYGRWQRLAPGTAARIFHLD
jgi:hypothetical protein